MMWIIRGALEGLGIAAVFAALGAAAAVAVMAITGYRP